MIWSDWNETKIFRGDGWKKKQYLSTNILSSTIEVASNLDQISIVT